MNGAQVNVSFVWCRVRGLNPRPSVYKAKHRMNKGYIGSALSLFQWLSILSGLVWRAKVLSAVASFVAVAMTERETVTLVMTR